MTVCKQIITPWKTFSYTISTTHFQVYIRIIKAAMAILIRINQICTVPIFHYTKRRLQIYCLIVLWKCGWRKQLVPSKKWCVNCWQPFLYYSECALVNPVLSWMPSVVQPFIGFHSYKFLLLTILFIEKITSSSKLF